MSGDAANDLEETVKRARKAKPGETLKFLVRRGQDEKTIEVKAGVLPFA